MARIHPPRTLAEYGLLSSLGVLIVALVITRPPAPFYALPLAPIALAALLFELAGGTLSALAALAGVSLMIVLDPDAARRVVTLQQTWPILVLYLVLGPLIGWLAGKERDRARSLAATSRQLNVVREITQTISTSLDLEETLQTIIAETRRLVPFERAAVLLTKGPLMQVVAVSDDIGLPSGGLTVPLRGSASGWAMDHRLIWQGNSTAVRRFEDTFRLCPPGRACLIVPLEYRTHAIGAYLLGGRAVAGLTPGQLDSLRHIAGHMAIAIEKARLYQAEHQRALHLAAIGDASREITASLDLERTLRLVMARAADTLPMDAGALFQYDAELKAYRIVVAHNLSAKYVDNISFEFNQGVPGWVVEHKQGLIIGDAQRDARVHRHVLQEGVQSVLAVPMVVRDHVVGVLALYARSETQAFDEEALRLADIYASQAAVAVDNAHLVEKLRQAAAELEARVERRTRKLRETQALAIRTEKLAVVGRLAASVAHEVNNPLQAIALHLQLITQEDLPAAISERLGIVQDELDHIAGIVQRLLKFQRPKPGDRGPQEIQALLDEVLALAGKQLQESHIRVLRKGEATLPKVLAAAGQLKQVFLNLVLNAAEAMPEGGDLTIRTEVLDEDVLISFADTGVGMSQDTLEALFEPFFSTKPEGSGLGLAISHEILRQHEGSLRASNQPDRGAIFTVRLPALSKTGAATEPGPAELRLEPAGPFSASTIAVKDSS